MKQLSQKVALVTGAGSGIGKAIAKLFAEQGAKVMLTDIHQSNIEAVAAEIRANGGMVACIAADISVKGDVQLVMKYVHNTFGTLDILVNNAGVMDNFTPVTDVTDELWEKVIGTNLNGCFFACREAIPLFLESGSGTVINIASISGFRGGRAGAAYTASKHAIIGLTKNIGYQYADKNIRCNAIAPGGVNTNIVFGMEPNPFGFERMNAGTGNAPGAAAPEAIAEVALFLASVKSSFINGSVLTADGGWTAY
ncbi:SDR family oxidoreductase [Mucilaginibacter rubeus]|uniref:SDR family oxidoreductase n=2 Tax=Mucilaginibacter TaxID=423349 RepID=A0AAE6JDZ5_9SPHI|nr:MULTISPECIES: SDR family oxidoreductase [Mucilaginibacter]QEM03548.1 SDR family oxidoreductase [Mucilaginibacter rubeus]QEM16159.1 SDR family oxidoreductase [Mucilaginibacter gossypii]QTE41083.1 SDR family oxidoreductase [Mucilaginibacter rubeus]QTE47686.1 SDR family oxidoreductase [Mucilaginibacter rubeus]QTE59078.1 SDR family oxidoreductase [Mucilaginibacter rubeus]